MKNFAVRILLIFAFFPVLCFAQSGKERTQKALDLMRSGLYDSAEETLRASGQVTPMQLRLLIELAERRGDGEETVRIARQLMRDFGSGSLQRSEELAQSAFAAWRLQRWEEANQIYIQASQLDGAPLSLFVDWGRLYLEKYNPKEAETIFRDALRSPAGVEPRWQRGHAFLGLAESLGQQGKPGAEQALSEAAKDPGSAMELLVFQVELALREENWERASELISSGMAANSGYLPLLELNCGLSYLQEDQEGFEVAKKRLSTVNPGNASLFEWLGDAEVRRRRLDEAIRLYDKALELDPKSWSAMASKGINLLRLGREKEGVAALELAYENDPYNIWTVNTLRLVDSFESFDRFETDHFSVRLHRDEIVALRSYVEEILEVCLETLEQRYDHEIKDKVSFEMYPDHEDFVVRALGLPGLGALGATFGNVVAMDSPSARKAGEFHWASTLWHEVAHVVTLSISNSRVPRWFTEGLSMMEERQGGRGWGEGLSLAFVRAFEAGRLLPLKELNSGFVRPKYPGQLAVSYYQAGWVCEFLGREFGMPKIREMLIAYGKGLTTEEVFTTVLESDLVEVDELFQKELSDTLRPLEARLAQPEATPSQPEQLKEAVKAHPENYFLNFALGHKLAESGSTSEAIVYLRRAVELFPSLAGVDSPYAVLAVLYRKNDRREEEIKIRSEWWERAPLYIDNALRLAEILEASGRSTEAARLLEDAMYVDPFSNEAHTRLGHLYLEQGDADKAVREFRAVLGLNPPNKAQAHFQLANALARSGERDAAKREILLALENAPGWEEAQRLLLELVRQ